MTQTDSYFTNMFGLHGKVAAVTGGGSGIGKRIAVALASAGAKVIIVGRRENLLQQTVTEIDQSAGEARARFVTADLSILKDIPDIARRISECFGAPNVIVHAAGVNLRSSPDPVQSSADITLESWQKTMDVNLSAPFFLSRALIGGLQNGGAIVNIGSMQSARAGLGDAAYTASKGGVAQLTRAMARAWGANGVRANAILPGFFPSDMTEKVFASPELSARLAESTLLGRNGELADLEGAAVFLSSPASSYITGILLPVDGGFLAK